MIAELLVGCCSEVASGHFHALLQCNRILAMSQVSVRLSVHPSVRSSLIPVDCSKMKETCAHIFIPHERSFILVF